MSIGGFVAFKELQLPLVDGTTPLPGETEKHASMDTEFMWRISSEWVWYSWRGIYNWLIPLKSA